MNLRTPKALRAEEQAPRRRTPKALRVMGGSCPRVAVSAIINNRCRPSRRLRALNRFSKSLCSFENRALRRAVLFRLRSAFADLAFRCAPGRACAVLRTATSVPPLDRVRQAAGGDGGKPPVLFLFIFLRGKRSVPLPLAPLFRHLPPSLSPPPPVHPPHTVFHT